MIGAPSPADPARSAPGRPLGRLADRSGRKAGFLLGLGLFIAASLGCAVAPGLWPLVVFRVLQAAGAALLTPTSLGLLLHTMPDEEPGRYLGLSTVLVPCAGARITVNGVHAKGRAWPRERAGRAFSTCALAFSESWTEKR